MSTAKYVRVYFAVETTVKFQSKKKHTFVALHPSMIEFIRESGIVYGPRTYFDMNTLYFNILQKTINKTTIKTRKVADPMLVQ